MTQLVVHIGAGKCGSSAIQGFLRFNHARLRSLGVLVPSSQMTAERAGAPGYQVFFFQDLLRREPLEAKAILNRRIDEILELVDERQRRCIVISAENLSNDARFAPMFAGLADRFDLQIVFYVRRQDDFLISAWHQWYLKTRDDFVDWLQEAVGRDGDWSERLSPWEALYGTERICVRRYSRAHLIGGDVVRDFIRVAALPDAEYQYADRETNRSYDEIIGYIAHDARDLFTNANDHGLYHMFSDLLGSAAYKSRRGSSLMTLAERQAVLEVYRDGNDRLKQTYFADDDEALFPEPSPDDVYTLSPDQRIRGEIAMLTRALFALYKRGDRGRRR